MRLKQIIIGNPGKSYILAAALYSATFGPLTEFSTRSRLIGEVERVIDYDKNGFADYLEWDTVYRGLGVVNEGKIGRDLSVSQLQNYLKNPHGKNPARRTFPKLKPTTFVMEDDEMGEVF